MELVTRTSETKPTPFLNINRYSLTKTRPSSVFSQIKHNWRCRTVLLLEASPHDVVSCFSSRIYHRPSGVLIHSHTSTAQIQASPLLWVSGPATMLHVTEEVHQSHKNIDDGNVINEVKSVPFRCVISSIMKKTVYGTSLYNFPVLSIAMPLSKRKFLRSCQYLMWIALWDKLFTKKNTFYVMRIKRKSKVGWLQEAEKFNYCYK